MDAQKNIIIAYQIIDSNINNIKLNADTVKYSELNINSIFENKISFLRNQSYLEASLDSLTELDTTNILVFVHLGKSYDRLKLLINATDTVYKDSMEFNSTEFSHISQRINQKLSNIHNDLLNQGFISSALVIDSISNSNNQIEISTLLTKRNIFYFDSLRLVNHVGLSNALAKKLFGLEKGMVFTPVLFDQIKNRIEKIEFLIQSKNPEVIFNGQKSDIALFLNQKNTNQANFMVGILPSNIETNKLLITGDINLLLKNSFGQAETLNFVWQQLQYQSPNLKSSLAVPYLLLTDFGISANFKYLKKDTTFRNVNYSIGLDYHQTFNNFISFYYGQSNSAILTTDTIKFRTNPNPLEFLDYTNKRYGILIQNKNTTLQNTPRQGWNIEFDLNFKSRIINYNINLDSVPTKKGVLYNTLIDSLNQSKYQGDIKLYLTKYVKINKAFTLVLDAKAQKIISRSYLKNEVTQIGGIQTLKGFDENAFYSTQYYLGLSELRYHMSQNSYFSIFANGGYIQHISMEYLKNSLVIGFGTGFSIQTNNGIFNLFYALGNNANDNILIKNAKIHLGYTSRF